MTAIEQYYLKKTGDTQMTTTATIAINEIYTSLADRFTDMDYATYSTYYLGRNTTYYSYLKSSGADASVEALFNLYSTLLHAEETAKEHTQEANTRTDQQIAINRSSYFGETKNRALNALIELAYERHEDIKESDQDDY